MTSFLGYVRVQKANLRTGHIYWIEDDKTHDLGPATLEDFRLLALVTEESVARLAVKRGGRRPTPNTLGRVRAFAKRLYNRATAVDNDVPV